MAACKNCGKSVGCGCNLNKDGLCATCSRAAKNNPPVTPNPVNPPNLGK